MLVPIHGQVIQGCLSQVYINITHNDIVYNIGLCGLCEITRPINIVQNVLKATLPIVIFIQIFDLVSAPQ